MLKVNRQASEADAKPERRAEAADASESSSTPSSLPASVEQPGEGAAATQSARQQIGEAEWRKLSSQANKAQRKRVTRERYRIRHGRKTSSERRAERRERDKRRRKAGKAERKRLRQAQRRKKNAKLAQRKAKRPVSRFKLENTDTLFSCMPAGNPTANFVPLDTLGLVVRLCSNG